MRENQLKEFTELSDEQFDGILDNLEGEQIDSEKWEVVDERDEGAEESYEDWANRLIQKKKILQ